MWDLAKRIKLADRMAVDVARDIVGERLKTGEALPAESDFGTRYGISKAVARESLQILASAGLLQVRHGKRTVVLSRGDWNASAPVVQQALWLEGEAPELIRQLYEIRRILEAQSAEWAAERRGDDHIARLEGLVDDMGRVARTSRDIVAFLMTDLAFHHTLATAARNLILQGLLRNLHSSLFCGWSTPKVEAAELESLTRQHARILSAVRIRDVQAATTAMIDHLDWAERNALDWPRDVGGRSAPGERRRAAPRSAACGDG